ncbi:HDIG domain-containing protein [Shewanella morhuae]|nr:HDIG domain-containing protein [Shewanella morhuae]
MNNVIFAWVKDIKISGHLPTANCEFISNKKTIHAITSADIARTCQFNYGLAQMNITHDSRGNVVICAMKPILTRYSENEYIQLTQLLGSTKEKLLGRFLKLLSLVTCPELQPFVNFIFERTDILKIFIKAQASYQHHHSYANGLFEHSIEVAEMTYHNAKHLQHSEIECQTGLVAGLFHDIGKIYAMLNQHIEHYVPGPHESYNFAILAKPLGELGTINSKVFALLSDLLAAKPYGHKVRYAMEYVLQQADRSSAQSGYVRDQFKSLPAHYDFRKVGDSVIRRLN